MVEMLPVVVFCRWMCLGLEIFLLLKHLGKHMDANLVLGNIFLLILVGDAGELAF